MLKEQKIKDPYKNVRRTNPPIDFPHKTKWEYDRNKIKQETEEIILEELEEYENLYKM